MSIHEITIDELRRMDNTDGLVLQGCGGAMHEWQDGINALLTNIGILKEGSRFEDIYVFQNKETTCVLFPFTEDMNINMSKLAMWRLRSKEQFGSMWVCDYVDSQLGGYERSPELDVQQML